jgi:excisionase family DNA binding protein
MTLKEAATLLELKPDTLRQYVRRGVLRAEKRGRDWHVTPAEVERYRTEHKRGG